MKGEERVREIVREEIRRAFKTAGIQLQEDSPKKGNRVRTPHGTGTVLAIMAGTIRVRLDSGAIIKTHRDRAAVID